jgi:hypothetical protein
VPDDLRTEAGDWYTTQLKMSAKVAGAGGCFMAITEGYYMLLSNRDYLGL